jgi:hypothetical protein
VPENLSFADPPLTGQPVTLQFGAAASLADLVFGRTPVSGGPVSLVFGEEGSGQHPDVSVHFEAILPALGGSVGIAVGIPVVIAASLPAIAGNAHVTYLSDTQRPLVGRVLGRAQLARQTEYGIAHLEQHSQRTNAGHMDISQDAQAVDSSCRVAYAQALTRPSKLQVRFEDGLQRSGVMSGLLQDAVRDPQSRRDLFAEGLQFGGTQARGLFEDGLKDRRLSTFGVWASALHRGLGLQTQAGFAARRNAGRRGKFQEAWVPPPGRYVPPVPPVVVPPYWGPHLIYECPPRSELQRTYLVFGLTRCEAEPVGPVLVSVRRVYYVINDVSLHRVVGETAVEEIPLISLGLNTDVSSWTWGFDAVLPQSAQSLLEPSVGGATVAPLELLARINGREYRLLAETLERQRSFGESTLHVTGRGRNAVLGNPYAPVQTFTQSQNRTAQQLMGDVLTVNGVSMDWSVDWGLVDWNVPAGVFNHQGTWMEALCAIANAAGGSIRPHATAKTVTVAPRYPVAPWEWGTVTPDFELPVDAVQRESLRWIDKPLYNRVFVSGEGQGILGQVTRAGSAGDLCAPMVVDALITESAAARQRGMSVLAEGGRQLEISLRMPVLAETSIIEPGAFVRYQDGGSSRIGLVRSTAVQAGFPEVWQTLGVQAFV